MGGDFFLRGGAGPGVGFEDGVEGGMLDVGVPLHHGFDGVPDGGEEDLAVSDAIADKIIAEATNYCGSDLERCCSGADVK